MKPKFLKGRVRIIFKDVEDSQIRAFMDRGDSLNTRRNYINLKKWHNKEGYIAGINLEGTYYSVETEQGNYWISKDNLKQL